MQPVPAHKLCTVLTVGSSSAWSTAQAGHLRFQTLSSLRLRWRASPWGVTVAPFASCQSGVSLLARRPACAGAAVSQDSRHKETLLTLQCCTGAPQMYAQASSSLDQAWPAGMACPAAAMLSVASRPCTIGCMKAAEEPLPVQVHTSLVNAAAASKATDATVGLPSLKDKTRLAGLTGVRVITSSVESAMASEANSASSSSPLAGWEAAEHQSQLAVRQMSWSRPLP